jgi:hypothetical protein
MHLVRTLADADGENRADASLPRASQHGSAIVVVALAVEVGVGVNQQIGPLGVGSG